jgi:hypothetical protein
MPALNCCMSACLHLCVAPAQLSVEFELPLCFRVSLQVQEQSTHWTWFLQFFPIVPVLQTARMATDLAAANTDLLIGTLQSSLEFWNSLPFNICFVGHALYATSAGGEFKDRWLLHLLVSWRCGLVQLSVNP